jgi:3-deoxy-manno-octulosonate cytidylyltransferase (CMP-KDO synthetase)
MIPHAKDGAYRPDSASYLKHVGLYAFQKNFLMQFPSLPRTELELTEDLEQLRILSAGYKIKIVKVDSTLPGVDTKHDLKYLTSVWPHKCSS